MRARSIPVIFLPHVRNKQQLGAEISDILLLIYPLQNHEKKKTRSLPRAQKKNISIIVCGIYAHRVKSGQKPTFFERTLKHQVSLCVWVFHRIMYSTFYDNARVYVCKKRRTVQSIRLRYTFLTRMCVFWLFFVADVSVLCVFAQHTQTQTQTHLVQRSILCVSFFCSFYASTIVCVRTTVKCLKRTTLPFDEFTFHSCKHTINIYIIYILYSNFSCWTRKRCSKKKKV